MYICIIRLIQSFCKSDNDATVTSDDIHRRNREIRPIYYSREAADNEAVHPMR